MPPIVTEPDFLGQDDVDGRLGVGPQEEIPLLPHQLPVPAVGQPRLAALEEDDACRHQHHQTGQEAQNHETDDLAAGDLRSGRLDRPKKLVKSRRGVMLRFHSALELVDVKFTRRPGESGRAGAGVRRVPTDAAAAVRARIGLADVRPDLTERASESRWTEAGGTAVRAARGHAGSSVLTAGAADERGHASTHERLHDSIHTAELSNHNYTLYIET